MPDVGIVMPVYNQVPEFLRTALRSIKNQQYENYAFVIVVDGANEETVKIIREETKGDQRVTIIVKKKNQGVPKALNTGFETLFPRSDIKYFTWVSSDNVYYSHFIKKHRETLDSSPPHVGLVYSSFRHINEKGAPRKDLNLNDFRRYQENPKENILDFCFIGASFMYKKEYAEKLGGYWAKPVEDYEYWLRLTELCDIDYIPIELMDYRENSAQSVSAKLNQSKQSQRHWRYMNNLIKQQARKRRNTPVETTVILLVRNDPLRTLEQLEKLLDQLYYNYTLVLLDTSRLGLTTSILQGVKDPRIRAYKLPGVKPNKALKKYVQQLQPPFTAIYDKNTSIKSKEQLGQLVNYHRLHNQGQPLYSTFINKHTEAFETRRHSEMSAQLFFGDIYNTAAFKKVVNQSGGD